MRFDLPLLPDHRALLETPATARESHSHHALLDAMGRGDGQATEEIMKSHLVDLHSGLDLVERDSRQQTLAEVFRG